VHLQFFFLKFYNFSQNIISKDIVFSKQSHDVEKKKKQQQHLELCSHSSAALDGETPCMEPAAKW
jgi:hypothetical protein